MEKYGVAISEQIRGLEAELEVVLSQVKKLCSPIPHMVKTAQELHVERSQLEKRANDLKSKIRELKVLDA